MSRQDDQIMRATKQLARRECANYADGSCLLDDCPCHVLNPAYKTIHDGAVNCDHFIFAVQPQQPELNAAFWHEIYREEDEVGKGWKDCVRCHKPFLPATANATAHPAEQRQNRPGSGKNSAATENTIKDPCSVTLLNEKSPGIATLPGHLSGAGRSVGRPACKWTL